MNRFQQELEKTGGTLAGREWSVQVSRHRRIPLELRPLDLKGVGQFYSLNEIQTSLSQRAFSVLETAGEWRRLALDYLRGGDLTKASVCKEAAHLALFHARQARLNEGESIRRAA